MPMLPLAVRLSFFGSLISIVMVSSTASCSEQATKNEREQEISNFKKICIQSDAAIDVYHIDDFGVAVVITATTDEHVKRIHAAAAEYGTFVKKTAKDRKVKYITETVNLTTAGALVHVFSSRPETVKSIQSVECCKWCVCPSSTQACVTICPHCK